MPSITTDRLKQLTSDRDEAADLAERRQKELDHHRGLVREFNSILDKIVRAANGQPLTDDRNAGGYHIGMTPIYGGGNDFRLTDAERAANEQERQRERIINLESRLAAVVAVAHFAKAHKA